MVGWNRRTIGHRKNAISLPLGTAIMVDDPISHGFSSLRDADADCRTQRNSPVHLHALLGGLKRAYSKIHVDT